jgi:hypothetical protein
MHLKCFSAIYKGKDMRHLIAALKKIVAEGDDYRGEHTAPGHGEGAPMWDLRGTYPDDIYTSQAYSYYRTGRDDDGEAIGIMQAAKGRRDKQIRVYRAIPKEAPGKFNRGDWVALTKGYAKDHGEDNLGGKGKYKLISKAVPARDLFTDGNSVHEWGYDPQPFTSFEKRDPVWEKWAGKKKEGDNS